MWINECSHCGHTTNWHPELECMVCYELGVRESQIISLREALDETENELEDLQRAFASLADAHESAVQAAKEKSWTK